MVIKQLSEAAMDDLGHTALATSMVPFNRDELGGGLP